MDDVLARLDPSPARRVFGVGVLAVLGVMLMWLSAAERMEAGARVFVAVSGGVTLYSANALWRASAEGLVLTAAGLFETSGRRLAAMEEIAGVDRGVFALKPSNGFVVRLRARAPFGYAPGLWWRWGRRIGVGGVTEGTGARAMADRLAMHLAERG